MKYNALQHIVLQDFVSPRIIKTKSEVLEKAVSAQKIAFNLFAADALSLKKPISIDVEFNLLRRLLAIKLLRLPHWAFRGNCLFHKLKWNPYMYWYTQISSTEFAEKRIKKFRGPSNRTPLSPSKSKVSLRPTTFNRNCCLAVFWHWMSFPLLFLPLYRKRPRQQKKAL